MASSSRGLSLGIVVLCLIGLGGVLYYSINQVESEIPESQVPSQVRQGSVPYGGSAGMMSGGVIEAGMLHQAAENGDAAVITAAIKSGAGVDAMLSSGSKGGLTPLMCAALAGKPESINALFAAGAKVSARGKDGKTALIYAAGWANPATVQAVLDGRPNIDERTDDRWTALMMAASRGEAASMKTLIDAGADVNAKNKWGQTALMAAARAGDAEKVSLLLAAGASVQESDIDGMTALSHAASSTGATALDAIKAIIEKKPDVNAPDAQGVSPLMRAADLGDVEKIKVLLAAGANKASKDRDGRDALTWATNRSDDAGRAAEVILK